MLGVSVCPAETRGGLAGICGAVCDHTAARGSGRPVPLLCSLSLNYAFGYFHLWGLSTRSCSLPQSLAPCLLPGCDTGLPSGPA